MSPRAAGDGDGEDKLDVGREEFVREWRDGKERQSGLKNEQGGTERNIYTAAKNDKSDQEERWQRQIKSVGIY